MIMPICHLPTQIKLETKRDLCGYVSPEGKYYPCGHYEHEILARKLVPFPPQVVCPACVSGFFAHKYRKPQGMLQEEYYLMAEKRYVKISSFKDSVNQMWLFSYYDLTPEQTDFIYPR